MSPEHKSFILSHRAQVRAHSSQSRLAWAQVRPAPPTLQALPVSCHCSALARNAPNSLLSQAFTYTIHASEMCFLLFSKAHSSPFRSQPKWCFVRGPSWSSRLGEVSLSTSSCTVGFGDFSAYCWSPRLFQSHLCSYLSNFCLTHTILSSMTEQIFLNLSPENSAWQHSKHSVNICWVYK